MPPKKDGVASKEEKKKARKRNKPRKKKDECPSRIRKTDRVVLNKQARDIIAKVYDFMKREALADYAEKLSNARWRTATAAGVSEKTVSRILKDRSKKHTEGSAVAGADAFVHGKIEAAKNYGQALGDLVTGNISGAAHSLATGLGDCIGADAAGLGIAASGVANATGQLIGSKIQADGRLLAAGSAAAGEFVGGNLAAAADVASGISALVSDDLSAAGRSFGSAAASLVTAESDAINTFLSKF